MSKTLLQKARESTKKSIHPLGIGDEHIELALAWAYGDVSLSAVIEAMRGITGAKYEGSNGYSILARALREAVRRGILIEK